MRVHLRLLRRLVPGSCDGEDNIFRPFSFLAFVCRRRQDGWICWWNKKKLTCLQCLPCIVRRREGAMFALHISILTQIMNYRSICFSSDDACWLTRYILGMIKCLLTPSTRVCQHVLSAVLCGGFVLLHVAFCVLNF